MLSLKTVKPGNVSSYFEKDDYYTKDDLGVSAEFHGRLAEKFGLKDAPFDREAFDCFIQGSFKNGLETLNRRKSFVSKKEVTELLSTLSETAFDKKRSGILKKVSEHLEENDRDFFKKSSEKYFEADGKGQAKIASAIAKKRIAHGSTDGFAATSKYITHAIPDKQQRKNLRDSVRKIFTANIRAGVDATFSAPKNVSIRALVEGDTRLEEAHKESVAYTLKHVKRETICTRITTEKERISVRTGNMLAGVFHHGTARETTDSLPDPQDHNHCVPTECVESNGKRSHF